MNAIPTQNNINAVVDSVVANANSATKIVNATVKSISDIAAKTAAAAKKVNVGTIELVINSYKTLISNIVSTICSNENENGNKVSELVNRVDEYSNNPNKDIKINTYTSVDVSMKVLRLMNNMFAVVERLSNFKLGFFAMRRLKKNITVFAGLLKSIITEFGDVFTSIDANALMNDVMGVLVSEPSTVERVSSVLQTSEYEKLSDAKTITKQGKVGLLDVLYKTFAVIDMMTKLKAPNFMKLKLQFILISLALKTVSKALIGISNDLQPIVEQVEGDQLDKTMKNIKNVFSSMRQIFKDTAVIAGLSILVILGFPFIWLAIKSISILISSIEIVIKKSVAIDGKGINTISDIIATIKNVGLNIVLLALLAPAMVLAMVIVMLYLGTLVLFLFTVNFISKFIKEISEEINKNIKSLILMFTLFLLVGVGILLLAIYAPVFMDALTWRIIPFLLAIVAGIVILFVMTKIGAKFAQKAVTSTSQMVISMLLVLGLMTVMGVFLLAMSKISEQILTSDAILSIILLIGLIVLLSGVLIGLGIALSAASAFIAIGLATLGMVAALLGVLLIVLLAVVALQAVSKKIKPKDFTKIIANIGCVSLLVTALGGIGTALVFTLPLITIAIASFTPVMVLLGMLVGCLSMILTLAKTPITEDIRDSVVSTVKSIGSIVKAIGEVVGEDSRKSLKQMRKGKKFLRQVKKSVKQIFKIAQTLNALQKITLNKTTILTNVQTVFEFVNDLNAKLDEFMKVEPVEANVTGNALMDKVIGGALTRIKQRANIKAEKRRNAQARERLNSVEKVITTIGNIIEAINSLQEFTLDEAAKSKVTKNMGMMFAFVDDLNIKITEFMSATYDAKIPFLAHAAEKKKLKRTNEKLSKVEAIVVSLGSILDTIQSLKDAKLDDNIKKAVTDNITNIFTLTTDISETVNENIEKLSKTTKTKEVKNTLSPIIEHLTNLNDQINRTASIDSNGLKTNLDNFSTFISKVNEVDVSKVESIHNMFEKMADFSNSIHGDFDKLAEALSEKLLPVLEDLKEIMHDVPEKLDRGFQNTSASIAAAGSLQTPENIGAQIQRENPNLTTEETDKLIKHRINEHAQQRSQSVEGKIDELIEMLSNSYIRVKLSNS